MKILEQWIIICIRLCWAIIIFAIMEFMLLWTDGLIWMWLGY